MGTKMATTTSMISSVPGVLAALCAVRLAAGAVRDGNILGKSPITPKKVTATMVTAEHAQALQ